jgi:hypothetical protein
MLDGPLLHKAYVLPMTLDRNNETVSAASAGDYRSVFLPIRKYMT